MIIGARSVDPGERELLKSLNIRVFTMSELDERGLAHVVEEAIEIASRNTAGIHVTFDMDFIDPFYAPGVGTPERGGADVPREPPRHGEDRGLGQGALGRACRS